MPGADQGLVGMKECAKHLKTKCLQLQHGQGRPSIPAGIPLGCFLICLLVQLLLPRRLFPLVVQNMHVLEDAAPISGELGTGTWAKSFNALLQEPYSKTYARIGWCDEAG